MHTQFVNQKGWDVNSGLANSWAYCLSTTHKIIPFEEKKMEKMGQTGLLTWPEGQEDGNQNKEVTI